jgi:steroid delta-isomerase-like uncharacterized protein
MQQTENTTVTQLFAAWNNHDVRAVLDSYHDDFTREDVGNNHLYGKDKLMQVVENYMHAFPDIRLEIDTIVEKNEQVVVCWTATGHHKEKIMNIPATGKHISFKGVSVLNIEDEKIKRVWYLWDQASMLRQMGLLPELQHPY